MKKPNESTSNPAKIPPEDQYDFIDVVLFSGKTAIRPDKTYITDSCIYCDFGYGENCIGCTELHK